MFIVIFYSAALKLCTVLAPVDVVHSNHDNIDIDIILYTQTHTKYLHYNVVV